MSRNHAQFTVSLENGESILRVTDANSTYHTFVNQRKTEANTPVVLHDGDIVRFGTMPAELSICRQNVKLCFSQLTKQEKNAIKVTLFIFN